MTKTFLASLAVVAFASFGGVALAQPLTSPSLRNLDSNAPVDIDADRIEALDQQHQVIFTGSVRMRQANMSLNADRIRVNYESGGKGKDPVIKRLDADGHVVLTSPTEHATANFGVYDVPHRVVTLIGNVRLAQNSNRIAGNRLTIDLVSGRSTMDGQSSTGQPGSRVSGRFTVPERQK